MQGKIEGRRRRGQQENEIVGWHHQLGHELQQALGVGDGQACALGNMPQYRKYTLLSFWLLVLGGFVFGPIVQKYAFDIFWSGFPFGGDLTDNKTLFAAIALLVAVVTGKKKWNRWAVVVAMAVMFAIFSIPHSMRGSELNHQTGVIESAK